jgi:hypothetical protein
MQRIIKLGVYFIVELLYLVSLIINKHQKGILYG